MKTEIFENYSAFYEREDKTVNGVSKEFANDNPKWAEERNSDGCWNCSGCSDCSDCSGCSGCTGCSDCSRCTGCYGLKNARPVESGAASSNPLADIPVIENIHQQVLEAVTKTGKLEMGNWHTCGTTHCRGGWVVTLAGESGKALEALTSSEFAAMQIYKASSGIKVSPVRFYETNEAAMADIERCAKEEAEFSK